MTIKLRNRKINTKDMNPTDLNRLSNVISWELSKIQKTSAKYRMLEFCKLIVKGKIRKAVCTPVVSYNLS